MDKWRYDNKLGWVSPDGKVAVRNRAREDYRYHVIDLASGAVLATALYLEEAFGKYTDSSEAVPVVGTVGGPGRV